MNTASVREIGITMGAFALLMAVLLAFAPAPAIAVARHVPADYPTIQAAVTAAASGDSILVAAGSYAEDVLVSGKSLALIGEAGPPSVSSLRWTSGAAGAACRVQGMAFEDSLITGNMSGPFSVSLCQLNGKLRIQATVLANLQSPLVTVTNTVLDGPSQIIATVRPGTGISIADCEISSPMALITGSSTMSMARCRFTGADLTLFIDYTAHISDCVFDGGGISGTAVDGCGVMRCQFLGGPGVYLGGTYSNSVRSSEITNCPTGVGGNGGQWQVTDNTIRGCGTGISTGGGICTIAGNVISGCDRAIRAGTGIPTIQANKISNCTTGILVDQGDVSGIRNNIISNCANGVILDGGIDYGMTGNTIVGCTGDAVRVQSLHVRNARFLSNIVAQSGCGFRFLAVPSVELTLQCNDVWNNPGGNWIGITDPAGTGGNISVDPLFCDVATDNYQLDGASPCLAGLHPDGSTCGLMGALGPGCGTPVRVTPSTWGRIKAQFR